MARAPTAAAPAIQFSAQDEAVVLGSALCDEVARRRLCASLKPDDFVDGRHKALFAAAIEVDRRGLKYAEDTVASLAGPRDAWGGFEYLRQIVRDYGQVQPNLEFHVARLRATKCKSSFVSDALPELVRACEDPKASIDELAGILRRWGARIEGHGKSRSVDATDLALSTWRQIERNIKGERNFVGFDEPAIDAVLARGLAPKNCSVLGARPACGKCLGLGTLVLTYDGRQIPVEDVKKGDLLMGPDSAPRRVLGTTRGRGPLFRLIPKKGDPWVCNESHVLTLVHSTDDLVVDIGLDDYLRQPGKFKHQHKLFSAGAEFPSPVEPLPLDPYFFGIWIGDGTKGLHNNGVALTKNDAEIARACRDEAAKWGLKVKTYTNSTGCLTHKITGPIGRANPLLDCLRALMEGKDELPRRYLVASRADRAAFLAGIVDTDGYVVPGGTTIEIVQRRRGYADGIAFLARSLGLRCSIRPKWVNDVVYWRMYIIGDASFLPTRIARKTPSGKWRRKDASRVGFRVEAIGDGEYAGFELDGDGRFLLGDFTVTHNSTFSVQLMRRRANLGKGTCYVSCEMTPEEIGLMMASAELRIPFDKLTKHAAALSAEERERLRAYLQRLYVRGLFEVVYNPFAIRADGKRRGFGDRNERNLEILESIVAKTPHKLVVVDLFGYVCPEQKVEFLDEAIVATSDMAKRHATHLLLLHHLKRGEPGQRNQRPTMELLRSTGAWEQYLDNIFLLDRPRKRKRGAAALACPDTLEVLIEKQRDGDESHVIYDWDGRHRDMTGGRVAPYKRAEAEALAEQEADPVAAI